jgi:hypothetical protein
LKKVFDWKRHLIEIGIWLRSVFDWKCITTKSLMPTLTFVQRKVRHHLPVDLQFKCYR